MPGPPTRVAMPEDIVMLRPPSPMTREAARILRELGTPLLINQPRYNMFDRERVEGAAGDLLLDDGVRVFAEVCVPQRVVAELEAELGEILDFLEAPGGVLATCFHPRFDRKRWSPLVTSSVPSSSTTR